MIFYLATETTGRKVLCGTQVDAKRIDKDFEQVDIPVDKKGLQAFVQESLDAIFELSKSQPALVITTEGSDDTSDFVREAAKRTLDRTGSFTDRFDDAREGERAAVNGLSRDMLCMTDKVMTLEGWALGQVAAAVTSRITELSKPYIEAPAPLEEDDDRSDEELLEIADEKHDAQMDDDLELED